MSKLSKAQIKAHNEACEILKKDILTLDDKYFVLENWKESANHVNSAAGAFFTPVGLARDFALEVCGDSILDLCAGIGGLSFAALQKYQWERKQPRIVCIEINPDYVAVGKKILPEAEWVCASVLTDIVGVGKFDIAISNPPFGRIKGGNAPTYTGAEFEFKVIDIASKHASHGVFILPQASCPFEFSGKQNYRERQSEKYEKFRQQTGIALNIGCSIDTAYYLEDWNGVSPLCEVVTADFESMPRVAADAIKIERVGERPSCPRCDGEVGCDPDPSYMGEMLICSQCGRRAYDDTFYETQADLFGADV